MVTQTQGTTLAYTPTDESVSTRDSMGRLPGVLALPLTFLTGKPHTGQRPVRLTPGLHLWAATASMLAGLAVSWVALWRGGWWLALLLVGWSMTLHGARNLRMMMYHQAAHRNMWARPRRDQLVGRLVAAALMVQDFSRYSTEHVIDHHAVHHMTVRDPTVQAFLIGLELRPGMSRRQMWRHLILRKLLSPTFHLNFLLGRVQSYFAPASWALRLTTVAGYAAVVGLAVWFDQWVFLLVAWVLPMTFFYQVSNTLRLCVKHTFPAPEVSQRRGREYFASLTNAIMIGERAPTDAPGGPLRRAARWARWWLRMLTVHFPARYLVLTGDTVVHDFHHRHPMSRDWANYIFARQADIDAGHRGWPPYREVWGLVPAINLVFDSLRHADPQEYDRARIAQVSGRSVFSAFDD
ncbi:fatty acid desaturase [Micromonospora radicis]|uniref:Stearoyl-CoA 9-desaturase n=1 Tax=Micromonospora radicis TaxID=1894971 RepID=A0A418N1J3_9ACTN|nr:fatty acid desaturase [Micromonospora radicis]RIV41486.1 stearoyl-CoA 9-desaturase [Micromonospora radicis]